MGTSYRNYITNRFGILLIILAVVIVAGCIYFFKSFILSTFTNYEIGRARLQIVEGNSKRLFEGGIIKDMTVLEALYASANAGNMKFNYELDKDGRLINLFLDGYYFKSNNHKISFYINSLPINLDDIQITQIKSGDTIEIVIDERI